MGLLDTIRSFTRRNKPPATPHVKDDIRLADFGIIQSGSERHIVNFNDQVNPGSITPEEAARLRDNTRGTGYMHLDLDDYIENSVDITVEKEDEEWMYEFWKMQKDDTVRDALNYILSALHTSQYYIEPASEEEQDLDIAAFVADSLGLDGKRAGKYPWERLLKIYELALLYRMSAGELVFGLAQDSNVILDKIIPIHPWNIAEIERDNQGGPRALKIEGTLLNEDGTAVDVSLPMWKTVTFVNNDEGNMFGESILEAAWLPWKIKRAMIQLMNAGFERFLLGIPILTTPKGTTKGSPDWVEARNTLTRFAMKPRTGMLIPDGFEFEIQVVNSQMPDALPYIREMNDSIYKSMGLSVANLAKGDNSSGSYTLSNTLSSTATQNVERVLNQFLGYVNTYLIPKLVMVNWPESVNYPSLRISRNTGAEIASILNAYGQMISVSLNEGRFDEAQFISMLDNAPSVIKQALGIDADRRRELVESRRRSVR